MQAPIRPSYRCLIFLPVSLCTSGQQQCNLAPFFLLLWLSFNIFSSYWKQLRQQTAPSYFELSFYLDSCSHSTISCQPEEQRLCTPVSTLGMYYSIPAVSTSPAHSLCSFCWGMGTISSPGGLLKEKRRWKQNAHTQVQYPWARKPYWEVPRSCPFGIVPSWTWHPQFHICVTQSPLCSSRLIFCLHINCLFLSWHPFSQLIHIHKLIASCYKTFPTPPLNIGQENAPEIINASNCSQHSALSSNTYFPKFWHFVPGV